MTIEEFRKLPYDKQLEALDWYYQCNYSITTTSNFEPLQD